MIVKFDWQSATRQLDEVKIFDYFKKRSMPDFVEPLVAELVTSVTSSPERYRHLLNSSMTSEFSAVLGWYARKLAGRAVRENSREDLWNALAAMAILASRGDFRDAMAPLALLHNSALRLHEDPKPLFERAAEISTQPVRQLFSSFLDGPAEQISIRAFGFVEGVGPFGFDYVPLLPEFGGPTPF